MASERNYTNGVFDWSSEMSRIYLPTGMIGSGKSTWARQFIQADPNVKVVAGDDIRYMLNGGKRYEYNASLEPTVLNILFNTTLTLLSQCHDVILDECYCSLNREMRANVVMNFPGVDIIPVIFPEKDMKDHIEDKVMKGLRGKTVNYWKRVFREMVEIYEPLHSKESFNEVIYVEESQ